MNALSPALFRTLRRYAAGIRAVREEIRTERIINELPASIRKDIGWPDAYAERRSHRNWQ